MARAFAGRGFDCTGVDLSEKMLAVAREKAAELALSVEWKMANLVELGDIPDGHFDYALSASWFFGNLRAYGFLLAARMSASQNR